MTGDALAPRHRGPRQRLMVLGYRAAYVALHTVRSLFPYRARGVKCLITRGEELLLVRHSYGPAVWHVPGGAMRRRENAIETARREMREELGMGDLQWRELDVKLLRQRRGAVELHRLIADAGDRVPAPHSVEIDAAQWFTPHDLPARMGREDRAVLEPPWSV